MKRKFTAIPGKGIFAGSKAASKRRVTAAGEKMYKYNGMMFDKGQMEEIRRGLKADVDVSIYADSRFDAWQMNQIRKGLEAGVDVSVYADPKFSWWQMSEICNGLESGVDVNIYADPKFNWRQMEQIREGLEAGVDVSIYADPKYDNNQMEEIREQMLRSSKPKQEAFETNEVGSNWVDEADFERMDPEEFAETYLLDAEHALEDELQLYIEPSTQAWQGIVVIYDESGNGNEPIEIDYQDWIETEQDIAHNSNSEEEFKNSMREYIKRLMEDAGWSR